MQAQQPGRRRFIRNNLALSSTILLQPSALHDFFRQSDHLPSNALSFYRIQPLDLSPAQWIWFPSQRTLPNTVIFFRKEISITANVISAKGWILGDSRYRLYCNGERIQWGPAPSDPRWAEADPVDLTGHLRQGKSVLAAEVLYYGFGDGTWPIGKPGFIFNLDIRLSDGSSQQVVTDAEWETAVANAWPPGQYKRWYLRSFQESFDARAYPFGWNVENAALPILKAMPIPGSDPSKPIISSYSRDYLYDSGGKIPEAQLRARGIPMMHESIVPAIHLSEQMRVKWKIDPETYFGFVTPEADSFEVRRESFVTLTPSAWEFEAIPGEAALLTFEFTEQHVGFPFFQIEANKGCTVELLVHEAHAVDSNHTIINTHFNSWSRFICKQGLNFFEEFDYESLRWMQLHIRNTSGKVRITQMGMRRRVYDFSHQPFFRSSDPKLNKLFAACVNTMHNQSQETIVDGMARERQQYSGDLGHVVHGLCLGFGEYALVGRFCNTYSQGLTKAGYFLDTWPAYDRLARLMEREIGMTEWGPLLDHGVGFNFDVYYYYLYTGDLEALHQVYPRLKIFFGYLLTLVGNDGLLPVEGLGVPVVWIDHEAYKEQKHKALAFNLYFAAMCLRALSPLARAMEEPEFAEKAVLYGERVLEAVSKRYWSPEHRQFICNLPWMLEEGEMRLCDRSLSMIGYYDLYPTYEQGAMIAALAATPKELGLSYPTNAIWRYWALAKARRIDVLLAEFRSEWYPSPSVQLNNTLSEFLDIKPDTGQQWSHASLAPFFCLYMSIAGFQPLEPGCRKIRIEPQLGDLSFFSIAVHTPHGPVHFNFKRRRKDALYELRLPEGVSGILKTKEGKEFPLKAGNNRIAIA